MTPFKNEAIIMLTALENAANIIEEKVLNPEVFFLKNKIYNDLKRNIHVLRTQLDLPIEADNQTETSKVETGAPLTKLFGKVLATVDTTETPKQVTSTEEIENIELEQKASELQNRFLILETEEIVNSIEKEVIYAVAKMAGVEVNKETPMVEFVDLVKETIKGKNTPKVFQTQEEVEADELRTSAKKLYETFVATEPDALLDKNSEIEIRAVAKMAGLPVTETNPKKIDTKYIGVIKEAIQKKAEIEEAGKK